MLMTQHRTLTWELWPHILVMKAILWTSPMVDLRQGLAGMTTTMMHLENLMAALRLVSVSRSNLEQSCSVCNYIHAHTECIHIDAHARTPTHMHSQL